MNNLSLHFPNIGERKKHIVTNITLQNGSLVTTFGSKQRFPPGHEEHYLIELSYETIYHKKIPSNYNICFAIPQAKKYIVWFTFYKNTDVCLLMELNRAKVITNISIINTSINYYIE